MIIDGHAHACGEYLTAESIIQNLNQRGADRVVLVPGELGSKTTYPLPNLAGMLPKKNVVKFFNYLTRMVIGMTRTINQIPAGNEYVYELKKKCQDRVIQFVWVTTKIFSPTDYLTQMFAEWKFHGVKLHQCWEKFSIDSDFFLSVAEWAENNAIPLFIHLWSDQDVMKLIQYKKKHRNLKLIVGHLFGLELFIKEKLNDDNLYFDISTFQVTSTHRLKNAIRIIGAEKILFGSDTPYGKNNLQRNMNRILALNIGEKEKQMILGENMRYLLKI